MQKKIQNCGRFLANLVVWRAHISTREEKQRRQADAADARTVARNVTPIPLRNAYYDYRGYDYGSPYSRDVAYARPSRGIPNGGSSWIRMIILMCLVWFNTSIVFYNDFDSVQCETGRIYWEKAVYAKFKSTGETYVR